MVLGGRASSIFNTGVHRLNVPRHQKGLFRALSRLWERFMTGCKEIIGHNSIIARRIITHDIINAEDCAAGGVTAPSLPVQELGTKQQWRINDPLSIDGRGMDPDDFGMTADPPQGSWNDADADRVFAGVGVNVRLLYFVVNSFNSQIAVGFCDHDDVNNDIGNLAHFSTVTFKEGGTGPDVELDRFMAMSDTFTANGILVRRWTQMVAGAYANMGTGSDPNSTVDIA